MSMNCQNAQKRCGCRAVTALLCISDQPRSFLAGCLLMPRGFGVDFPRGGEMSRNETEGTEAFAE